MYIGMLWFDGNPKKSLANKVDDAVLYYREKYGKIPNTVQLHPSMLSGQFALFCGNVQVKFVEHRELEPEPERQ